jgi:hypothetical protein
MEEAGEEALMFILAGILIEGYEIKLRSLSAISVGIISNYALSTSIV